MWNAQEIEEKETILSSFYFEFFNLMIRSHSSALLVLSLIISLSSFINISFKRTQVCQKPNQLLQLPLF